jgi:hypothetical protein
VTAATPPPHPPSPRAQRAAAARPPAAAGQRAERSSYLALHWRGELPLAVAVMLGAAAVWAAVQGLRLAGRFLPHVEFPWAAALLWLLEVAVLIGGALWWGMGVQRAAVRSVDHGGSLLVAQLAGVVGYGAFLWVGLFWLQSARHVWVDVRATLSGELQPAVVRVEPGFGLSLQGPLEYGTTRAVREALDAHPAIRVVRLDSIGGRVAEGLALGRLLLDRNLDTLVTAECSSACVTAFAGGARRLIGPAARIGLHSAGGSGISAAHVDEANRRSDEFIAERGVDRRVLERGAATASDDIWFPTHAVLLASQLATERAGP